MRQKTWLFLALSLIYSVTEGCNVKEVQSTDCPEGNCIDMIRLDNSDWECPSGYHLEYKYKGEIKTSTSGITCVSEHYELKEDRTIHFKGEKVKCRGGGGMTIGIKIAIVVCVFVFLAAIGGGIFFYLKYVRGAKETGGNVEEGKEKSLSVKEVSARSKSISTEPTSGMKKPTSSMMESSPNKKSSDDSSERKKSEMKSERKSEKSKKEKKGSSEQRSRGSKEKRKEGSEKGGSEEKRGKSKGKSKERRGSAEKRGGSKEKKKEEGGSMEKGKRGIEGGSGKRPRIKQPKIPRGNTLKEAEQAKLNQRKGKLPVPNLAKCDSWEDPLFEEILKVWMNFSINERIGFCEQMLRKMNGMIAVQFMRLFQNALFVENDRRVWTKLHECFRLLYAQCEAEYYMNICERMYQTVTASAVDKLDKMGWQEKATDNVDDAYLRYICADLVLFDCQTDNIAKLYKLYDEMKFQFVSPLRIAVWTRVVREDDLANEKTVLQQFLFEEAKLPRVKLPNEEYGTKLQHLIYAASTSKDPNWTKELWKRLITEKNILPAELVFVFKGTMIYPGARKRCLDLFMEDSFFHEKIPSSCPEYKEILRLFANSCVREAELQKIKDHVMADFAFSEADKKSFDFDMLEKRMASFLKEVPILHATMNKYLIEDRDFLVHKK